MPNNVRSPELTKPSARLPSTEGAMHLNALNSTSRPQAFPFTTTGPALHLLAAFRAGGPQFTTRRVDALLDPQDLHLLDHVAQVCREFRMSAHGPAGVSPERTRQDSLYPHTQLAPSASTAPSPASTPGTEPTHVPLTQTHPGYNCPWEGVSRCRGRSIRTSSSRALSIR